MTSQAHQPSFFLLKVRLPASESENLLGRVIRRYQDPTLDYTPESPSASLTASRFAQFLQDPLHNDAGWINANALKSDRVWTRLQALIAFSTDVAQGGTSQVAASRITTRRLKLENEYFKALKQLPAARRKILEMCPVGSKVYLVVGTMSARAATFQQHGHQHRSYGVSAAVPLSAASLSAGVPLPLGIIDPEAGVETSRSSSWSAAFRAGEGGGSGEEVFAIAVKEITRDWTHLGNDVKMSVKRVEYRGGQVFGTRDVDSSTDEDSDDSEVDDAVEELATESLTLTDASIRVATNAEYIPIDVFHA